MKLTPDRDLRRVIGEQCAKIGKAIDPRRKQDTFGLAYYLFGELLPGF